jgi:hypothetical protein
LERADQAAQHLPGHLSFEHGGWLGCIRENTACERQVRLDLLAGALRDSAGRRDSDRLFDCRLPPTSP